MDFNFQLLRPGLTLLFFFHIIVLEDTNYGFQFSTA